MTALAWILIPFVLLFGIMRLFAFKVYALKLTPHHETPEKFGIPFEEIRFPTRNERSLYGWWMPSRTNPESSPTLVLVHGWSRNLGRMLRYIEHLYPLNYNLLAFDARHHGSSDKDGHSSMFKFGQDVQSAVKYATTRNIDPDKIGVIGLSIGGAGATYASGIEPAIKAVVTVGAPAHPVDVMTQEFKRHHLPTPVIWYLLRLIESKIGAPYEEFAPVNNIAKSQADFLVIHGEKDKVVPLSQGEKLRNAARDHQCDYWRIPDYGHSNCHHHPDFWDRMHAFFQQKLFMP